MSFPGLNLARRPFANARPVVRGAALLWILGALLFAANVFLYRESLSGRTGKGTELVELEEQLESVRREPDELTSELRDIDLEQLNAQVQFLNSRIGGRTFGWSDLFDRLTEVLPNQARLTRLRPRVTGEKARETVSSDPLNESPPVQLDIEGVARDEGVIVELVDALFAHPQFAGIDLSREAQRENGEFVFSLEVEYRSANRLREDSEDGLVAAQATQVGSESGEQTRAQVLAAMADPEAEVVQEPAVDPENESAGGDS